MAGTADPGLHVQTNAYLVRMFGRFKEEFMTSETGSASSIELPPEEDAPESAPNWNADATPAAGRASRGQKLSTKSASHRRTRRTRKRFGWLTKCLKQAPTSAQEGDVLFNDGITLTVDDSRVPSDGLVDATTLISARDIRAKRLRKAANIAKVLLHVMLDEIEVHGLFIDYVGYPYKSRNRMSSWDRPNESCSGDFIMGQHQELFPEAIAFLEQDLRTRGFIVHKLTFREEKITFPLNAEGDCKVQEGIGLGWHLA